MLLSVAFNIFKKQPLSAISVSRCFCSIHGHKEIKFVNESPGKSSEDTTVDKQDIIHHERLKYEWWNRDGPMRPLHSLNKLRVQFVRDGLLNTLQFLEENRHTAKPLLGAKVIDVGCGGGILSEPLSRLGASVTGIDASPELIALAQQHAKVSSLTNIEYVNDSIENFVDQNNEAYDGVVASEIIEHVSNKELFIDSCIKLLKPGGSIFITTFNKTNLSWLGGIVFAEYILRIVPQGTHQWDNFISPHDMSRLLDKYGCKTKLIHGMMYVPINDQWFWISNRSVNYALHATKKIT